MNGAASENSSILRGRLSNSTGAIATKNTSKARIGRQYSSDG